ncbi:MAG: hypothetical protein WCC06_06845 [Candidatus Aminicenantales bacterium]
MLLTATPQGGNRGTSAGQITVDATARAIVSGIKSCATGRSANSGAELGYILQVDNVENLVAGDSKVATMTFTLTDAS